MWRHGRSEGKRTKGGWKRVSVDVHASRGGANCERKLKDKGDEDGRGNEDKNGDGRKYIGVYVSSQATEMSNGREQQAGTDAGRRVQDCGSSAESDDRERSGSRS